MFRRCRLPLSRLAILSWALASPWAQAQDLPQDWRLPAAAELAAPERQESPRRYAKTAADFNGDGVIDEAYVLRHERSGRYALWVLLSAPAAADPWRWMKLADSAPAAGGGAAMGLDTLPAGTHAYTCFWAAKNCDWNATPLPRLTLRDPGLRYFNFSGEVSYFFWSRSRQAFLRVHASR